MTQLNRHAPDPTLLRAAAYAKRDGESLRALWKTIEYLQEGGIDIGKEGEQELLQRKLIKQKRPRKI